MFDVLVIGSGPAGLALSTALARAGLQVGNLAPASGRSWPQNFGAWVDETEGWEVAPSLARVWPRFAVHVDDGGPLVRARAYGRLDNDGTRAALVAAFAAAGGRSVEATAIGVSHDVVASVVEDDAGGRWRARLVVDATGGASSLVERTGEATHFQAAWGVEAELAEGGLDGDDVVTLMDFRDADPETAGPPSFLYAMPLDGGRVFVEETSLIAAPAMSLAELRRRLDVRLARRGIRLGAVHGVERCLIPMDTPLPAAGGRVLAWGASGGMVHPATGYSVSLGMRRAGEVARAVASAIGGGAQGAELAAVARSAVWTPERLRTRELFLFGARIVATLGPGEIRDFYRAFFAAPDIQGRRYLSGEATVAEVAGLMWSVFRQAPGPIRRRLVRAGVGVEGMSTVRALVGA